MLITDGETDEAQSNTKYLEMFIVLFLKVTKWMIFFFYLMWLIRIRSLLFCNIAENNLRACVTVNVLLDYMLIVF